MKKLYTSSFNLAGREKKAVAISVGVPGWYKGKRFNALAPTWEMVKGYNSGKLTQRQYTIRYNKILKSHDAKSIVKLLPSGSILLCWEAPGDFCHRRLAAKWIEKETGIVVPELSDKKLEEFFDL